MSSSSVYSSIANSSYSFFRILAEASASESSTSVANNTSTIGYTVKATFKPTNGYSFSGTSRPNAGYVDVLVGGNVVKTITVPLNNGVSDGTVIASGSGSTTVAHNADGTGSTTVQVRVRSGSDQNNYNFVWSNATGSASTLSLSTIPRASSISSVTPSVVVNGSNKVTVNISRKSDSFTHDVTIKANDSYKTTITGVGTSTSYAIPITWINAIGSNASATVTVTVQTKSGSANIGSAVSTTFTIVKPSASTVTCTSSIECNGSNSLTVGITRAHTDITHTVRFAFGSYSQEYTGVGTQKVYAPPMTWLNAIPNNTSGTGSVTVTTYYGSISLGSNSKNFTLSVPTSVVPTLTLTAENIGPHIVKNTWGIYLQNVCQAVLSANASGSYSSTIQEYIFDGVSQSSSSKTYDLTQSGDITFKCYVKDSRGRASSTASVTIPVIPYSMPSLSCNMLKRCLSNGTVDDEGTYIVGNYSFSCASCGGNNTISAKIYTREVTEDEYVDKGSITSGSNTIIGTYDIVYAYAVKVVATDAVGNSAVFASIIETSTAIIDIMKGGEGMALGMMASKSDTLQIGYGKVDIEEGLLEVNHVDTESGNRIKTTIGSQNGYYSHYYTTAPNGNYFGQKVTVDNEIVSTSDLYGQSSKKVAYESDLLNKIYPVGSIYMSVNSTSPATLFGGTWQQLKDRFLIGAGSSYANGATGGATSHTHTTAGHTLTVAEMPSHEHAINYSQKVDAGGWASGSSYYLPWDPNYNTGYIKATATGGGGSHSHGDTGSSSNMPPYLAVYMWKRTA